MARILAALLLALVAGCAQRTPVAPTAAAHSAAQVRTAALARGIVERDRLPGLSVAVLAGGRTVVRDGFGLADTASGHTVDATTLFRIGSVSKLLTVAAAARLVDQGRLDLDAPIGRYLPGLSPALARVTSRQLAGHLAGIRHYGAGEYANRRRFDRVDASLAHFLDDAPSAAPGERYMYSSYSFNLLGAVLQAASGKEFRRLVADEVLGPLRLGHTRPETEPGGPGQARLYQRDTSGLRAADSLDVTDRWPSGGYLSTGEDLVRFAAGMLEEGYLSDATRTMLFTSQRTTAGRETGVGLAWRIGTDSLGRRFLHHGGLSNGGRAFLLLYPAEKVAVALLTNSTPARFADAEARAIAEPFLPPLSTAAE
jgi:CubicO group peptidase (beta-lactamase class C family)